MRTSYSLLDPEHIKNPYPLYTYLRKEKPLYLDAILGCWILSRYEDVMQGLAHPNLSSSRFQENPASDSDRRKLLPLFRILSRQMVATDPPDQTRLRAPFVKAFTPRVIAAMRPRIQRAVDTLLDDLMAQETIDVIADLAYPLPIRVIADLLGIRQEDHQRVKLWSQNFASFLGDPSMEKSLAAQQSILELIEYFQYLVKQREQYIQHDFLQTLLSNQQDQSQSALEDLLANCALLLFAGHETTKNLLSNAMFALFAHPDQYQKLQADLSLLPSCIEESLRFESPTQWVGRNVKESFTLHERKISKGQSVILILASANRDKDHFPEPDVFNITRHENKHLAFGYHRHFCVGSALARLEGHIILYSLIQRFPHMQGLPFTPEWQENSAMRGLTRLPVRLQV